MNYKRLGIYFLLGLILVILIFKTFFSPNILFGEKLDFGDQFIGYKTFSFIDDKIIEKKITDKNENILFNKTLLLNKINLLDNIYYLSDNYGNVKINTEGKNINIKLSEGLYLLDLNNIEYNYDITFKGFSVTPESSGKIFIDTRNSKEVILLSLDGVYDINLLDYKINKNITNLYLYPHMFLVGNISRIKNLKNADLSRLSKIFKIGYNNSELIRGGTVNLDFVKNVGSIKNDDTRSKFLLNVLKILFSNYNGSFELNKKLNSNSIGNVSGFDYIEKYFNYFQNDEKKIVFYKNLILKEVSNLFKGSNSPIELRLSIINNINELELLSKKDSDDIKTIIDGYLQILVNNNNIEKFNIKEDFSLLVNKVKSNSSSKKKSYLYLNSLFYSYNINSININYKDYLNNFIELYFTDLGIDKKINHTDKSVSLNIKGNKKLNNTEIEKNLSYISFLLFNVLKTDFDFGNNSNENNLLIENYLLINELLLNKSGNDLKITYLYYYKDLLDVILKSYKNNFFEKDRDDNGFLLLSNNGSNKKTVRSILSHIDYFFSYINKNKKLLDFKLNRNILLLKENKSKFTSFKEFRSAYIDYEQYKLDYDSGKSKLIDTDSITGVEDYSLSTDKILKYLKTFNGLYLNNISIDIIDDYYYSITNLLINGKKMSFDFYPDEESRITNIFMSNTNGISTKIKFSYKLDEIKEEWDEKFKEEEDKEKKEEYNFKSFFINTFYKKRKNGNIEYVNENKKEDEDKGIVILKKDKLLGEQGDFINIKDILTILYDNIKVTNNNGNYNIEIINSKLKLKPSGSNLPLEYDFSSDYIFSKLNHSFKNIVLTPYKIVGDKRKEYFLGEEIRIKINGIHSVIDTVDFFNTNTKNLELINRIAKVIGIKNLRLEFFPNINKILSSFNYSGKDIKIMFNINGNISSIKVNGIPNDEFIGKKYIELKRILIKL